MGENYFITNGICKVTETNREGYHSGNMNYGELYTEKVDEGKDSPSAAHRPIKRKPLGIEKSSKKRPFPSLKSVILRKRKPLGIEKSSKKVSFPSLKRLSLKKRVILKKTNNDDSDSESDSDSDSDSDYPVDKESKKPIPFIFPSIIKDMYVDDLYINETDSWNQGYCPLEYVENIEEERHSSRHDEDDDYEDKYDVLHNRWRNGTFIMRINGEIHNVNMLVMLLQVEEIMEIVSYDRYMYLVKNTELTKNEVPFDLLHITKEESYSAQRIFKGLRVILEKLWHAIMDDEHKDIEIVKKLYRMMLLSYSITCSRIQRLATESMADKDLSLAAKRKIISILYVVYKKLDNLKRLNMERILG